MKTILLIEDEKILGGMYVDKFKGVGYETQWVFSTEEALEYLKTNKPDLILLDILLPRKNGIGFLEEFKNTPEFASIPVVGFSNFDDPETKEKAFALGVKDYLIKTNFTPQEVLEKIKKYLE